MRTPSILLVAAVLLPTAAFGQGEGRLCGEYRELASILHARFREKPVSLGIQNNGHLLQMFVSEKGETWTLLSVAPTGRGCVVATGRHWYRSDDPAEKPAT